MPLAIRNLASIREKNPDLGQALDDVLDHIQNVMTQTNVSIAGQSNKPPAPSALNVTAAQGIFDASIHDNNPVSRGINYFLEYSKNQDFSHPTTVDLGQSRNYRAHLGNQTLYWRAHSSYPTGPRSNHAYHGGPRPLPVVGGGVINGPEPQDSQGSGTSVGASGADGGFGNQQYRRVRPTGL